jgi:O-antigen/teichoic acid export membrane protein
LLIRRLPDSVVGALSQGVGLVSVVVTTWFVARTDGLAAAGVLTVQLATAGAVFGVAQWGLRNLLLVEGTRHFGSRQFVQARVLMSLTAWVLTLSLWAAQGALSWYALAATAFKCGDAFTDLRLGVIQLQVSSRQSFERVLSENIIKAVLVLAAGLTGWFGWVGMGPAMATAAFGAVLLSAALLWRARGVGPSDAPEESWHGIAALLARSAPVAVSTIACTLLTTLPRALLGSTAGGDRLGVAGVSLTLGGVMSLLLASTWVVSARRVRLAGWSHDNLRSILLDYVKATALLLCLAPIFGALVTFAYGFPPQYLGYSIALFAAAALFYAGMGLGNVQKFTARRELETVSYLLGAAVLVVAMRMAHVDAAVAMVLSGATMAVLAFAFARRSLAFRPAVQP